MRVVGSRRGVVLLVPKPMVWHQGAHRTARGFSREEIEKSGAFPNGIVAHLIIDPMRKSCLKENIESLQSGMGRGMQKKKVN